MALTTAQLPALKTSIQASEFAALFASPTFNSDDAFNIAAAYNLAFSPNFTVWRANVGIQETGKAFNGAEWAGMSQLNHTRLQTVGQWSPGGYNAGLADIRAMFNDIWSGAGGTTTRASLLALWKRFAKRAERIYATGTGSDAVPAVLVFEGNIDGNDVSAARAV